MKTIRISPTQDYGYQRVLVSARIVMLSQDVDKGTKGTWIHLDTGDKIFVSEKIDDLEKIINKEDNN
jgi:hypothetical protein